MKSILIKILIIVVSGIMPLFPIIYLHIENQQTQNEKNREATSKIIHSLVENIFLKESIDVSDLKQTSPYIDDSGYWSISNADTNLNLLQKSFYISHKLNDEISFVVTNKDNRIIFKSLDQLASFGQKHMVGKNNYDDINIFIDNNKIIKYDFLPYIMSSLIVILLIITILLFLDIKTNENRKKYNNLIEKSKNIYFEYADYIKCVYDLLKINDADTIQNIKSFWMFLNDYKSKEESCVKETFDLIKRIHLNNGLNIDVNCEKKFKLNDKFVSISIFLMTIECLRVTLKDKNKGIDVLVSGNEQNFKVTFFSSENFYDLKIRKKLIDSGNSKILNFGHFDFSDFHYLLEKNNFTIEMKREQEGVNGNFMILSYSKESEVSNKNIIEFRKKAI